MAPQRADTAPIDCHGRASCEVEHNPSILDELEQNPSGLCPPLLPVGQVVHFRVLPPKQRFSHTLLRGPAELPKTAISLGGGSSPGEG